MSNKKRAPGGQPGAASGTKSKLRAHPQYSTNSQSSQPSGNGSGPQVINSRVLVNPKPEPIPTPVQPKRQGKRMKRAVKAFKRGEVGDAYLLFQMFGERIAFDHSEGLWYLWNGNYWELDRVGEVHHIVTDKLAGEYLMAASKARAQGKKEWSENFIKRAKSLSNRRRVLNVLYMAANPYLGVPGDGWDHDPWLLGTKNGTINLHDGSFKPGNPKDHIKTIAPTEWTGLNTAAPRWEKFLDEIFGGDPELVGFIQRLLGYGLTGSTEERIFPILWGAGSNGKSTLLEILKRVLGDLAMASQSESVMDIGRGGEKPQPFVYALRGRRLVWASESREGSKLNAGLVKGLTGGDTINARTLHSKPVEFQPTHLLMLLTNPKPAIPPGDEAIWDRVLLVPFQQRFVNKPDPTKPNEHKKDLKLREALTKEASGILAWLTRGCLAWQQRGLTPPDVVKVATQSYRSEQDNIGLFVEETCLVGPGYEIKSSSLYQAYKTWCYSYGMKEENLTVFGSYIKARYLWRKSNGVIYEGIGLSTTVSPYTEYEG